MQCWCNGQCPNIREALELIRLGRPYVAENVLKAKLADAPFCVEANRVMANLLTDSNRGAFAAPHLARVAAAGMTHDTALTIGHNARSVGRMAAAIEAYRTAIEFPGRNVWGFVGLAGALEAIGDFDQAGQVVEQGYLEFPHAPELRRVAAAVQAGKGDNAFAVKMLAGDQLAPLEFMDRGRYKEKLGDYDGAWADWMHAKYLLATRGHLYNADQERAFVEALTEITTPARFDHLRGVAEMVEHPPGPPEPIFITGFPRSGTTLLETILSMHDFVGAGDEMMFLGELVQRVPQFLRSPLAYPHALMSLLDGDNAGALDLMRAYYVGRADLKVQRSGPVTDNAKAHVTDKMPLNEVHAPFMKLLFPHAPILYMRRHPLDIVLSAMSHVITHGNFYASSLENAARHYVLLDRLMMHYRRRFPDMIREVRYEHLVQLPEVHIRLILSDCHLPFRKACLAPHDNARTARTISYLQVKAPIHVGAIERHAPFKKVLAQAIELLRPICEREGYDV